MGTNRSGVAARARRRRRRRNEVGIERAAARKAAGEARRRPAKAKAGPAAKPKAKEGGRIGSAAFCFISRCSLAIVRDRAAQAFFEIDLRLVPERLAGFADVGQAFAHVAGRGGLKTGATFVPRYSFKSSISFSRFVERPLATLNTRPLTFLASAASKLPCTTLPTNVKSAIAGHRQKSAGCVRPASP